MLNSIKTFKRSFKVTSNVFFYKKLYDDEKKIVYMIDFLCKIEILLLNMLKLLKILGFFLPLLSNSRLRGNPVSNF